MGLLRKPALAAMALVAVAALGTTAHNTDNQAYMDTDKCTVTAAEGWEDGFECGVSAAVAWRQGRNLVLAGGCNFPVDPLGPASQKRFYKGIYLADTATVQWQRIGSLPEPLAYAAYAPTPAGLAIVGGLADGVPSRRAMLLAMADGMPLITPLPDFPAPVDNAYGCAIGRKVYVVGGNYAGESSRRLHVLDLDSLADGWRQLEPMPGNARVQPVMAAGRDAQGRECLYVWGGFATGPDGPTVEVDGVRYDPATGQWSPLPPPLSPEGKPFTLLGGVAVTLSDGTIATAGGVNRDIFIEAVRNMAPDYLLHPREWYGFNQTLSIYDPATGQWSIAAITPEAARAGAAVAPGPDRDLYIIGGELKPRIRTPHTSHLTK